MVSLIGSSVSEVCHKASSEFEESTMTDNESHTPRVSLLERLKAPKHSDLTQKCTVDQSPPPKGKKRPRYFENNWMHMGE